MAELDGWLFQLVSHYKANFITENRVFPMSEILCFSIFKRSYLEQPI